MTLNSRFLVWLGVLLASVSLQAKEPTDVDRLIAVGQDDNRVHEHLDILCNRIGPRLTASDGLQRACEWAVERFKAMGLENARLEKWGEFPVGFDRGPAQGRMLEPEPMFLQFGTNAWTAGTKGRERGKAVLAPASLEELEKMRDEIRGAWVLMKSATPPTSGRGRRGGGADRAQPQNPDQENREEARARAREAFMQARRDREKIQAAIVQYGAAGVVRSTRDERILTGGRYQISWDDLPKIPEISLLKEQFDQIVEKLEQDERVVLEFDIRNYFKKGPIPLYNVIADIPGTEFPDEYVVVGGHIDSWDGATGATDNAAGCATTLEAARILMRAGVKPRRTIRFMLWSGEEQGLLGSRAYVDQNPDVVKKVSACLVHDGGTNYVSGIKATEDMIKPFEEIFAPVKQLDPRTPFEIERVDVLRGGGSDHASFLRGGAPGFFWNQAGRAVYRQTHHTQLDTSDSIVPEYQEHTSIIVAVGALGIANLDEMLPRDKIPQRQ